MKAKNFLSDYREKHNQIVRSILKIEDILDSPNLTQAKKTSLEQIKQKLINCLNRNSSFENIQRLQAEEQESSFSISPQN